MSNYDDAPPKSIFSDQLDQGPIEASIMSLFSKIKDRKSKRAADKSGRKVFAHYMIGLTHNQSFSQWTHDIVTAKECGIDGFALNMGPSDSWTYDQLQLAFQAAEQAGDFVLFPSFDMACGNWQVDQVVGLINHYKQSPAQMTVDGRPFVSTFEGPGWAENWATVRHQTGDIFLVPDWSSLGPYGVGQKLDIIDGAFSWDAWPKAGHPRMSAHEDRIYKECLSGKKYMMGVSPYFYTKLPQWNKNWYSSSESLWHDRWQQVLEIMPDYVQVITWNDFGESSYICDTVPAQIVQGADKYVNDYSHSAFRAVLPPLIAAYKAGSSKIDLPGDDTAIAWYRKTPAGAAQDGDTKWGQGGSQSAAEGARDVISVMAVTKGSTSVTVAIGGQQMTFSTRDKASVNYFEMPFDNGTTGPVTISLNGRTTHGPEITCDCDEVIFNAVVIQV